jgi:hypothetical protein
VSSLASEAALKPDATALKIAAAIRLRSGLDVAMVFMVVSWVVE